MVKISEISKLNQFYQENNIKLNSCEIKYENGKKKLEMKSWNDEYDKNKNGVMIQTGKKNNICDLELDNMEDQINKELSILANECSNFIYQSKKGFHYWFQYDEEMGKTKHVKNPDLDFLADVGLSLCPPSTYKIDKEIVEYKVIKIPKKGEKINKMSDILKDKLLTLFTKNAQPKTKTLETEIIKENLKTEKHKINMGKIEDEKIKQVLEKLHIKRADDYAYWIMTGLALKSDGYDCSIWDEFSKRSSKYQEGECFYLWNKLKVNRITVNTLFYWLKQDNNDEFQKLKTKVKPINYDKIIDLTNEKEYNDKKMYQLLKEDVELLGEDEYIKIFNKTISFKYFNNFHIHFTNGDMHHKIEYEGNRRFTSNLANIFNSYGHLKINSKYFIPLWKESIERQRYDKVNFLPNQECPINVFNTFSGFVYNTDDKKYDYKKIEPLIEHLKIMCNNDDVFNFVIKWWAWIRQHPDIKTKVALVFYSDTQGTGKNTVVDILASLFKGYTTSIKEEDIGKKFNKKFESKLFIWGDEISGNNKHDSNALKNLISQTIQIIEPKGGEEYEMMDNGNYCFTTNHSVAFRIDDKERRMLLI
jgi:hypothetical protein